MPRFILSSGHSDDISENTEEPSESMASVMAQLKNPNDGSLMTFMGDPEIQAKGKTFKNQPK